ncbi:DsbA family oxidoreductase [Vibrio sp. T187]|uniref:DsbA family oxidoreductase n=1 Tax=Vibrio TaxID=662 RepID=UPI0010C9F6A7|nr:MULTISPECIES: DsbA family oxidoreductase [Vibrio]MBW3698267.1 DsbA family oxidoreductase [Vibrio sp. T187]
MKNVTIDIVSDVVCPWCIIGYKRLELALEQLQGEIQADVQFHPFELNPNMPAGGQNLGEHLAEKYGTTPQASAETRDMITKVGQELGFTFNFTDEMRMYNTRKAHQLLLWAKDFGKQKELKLALFDAYFTNNRAVEDEQVLLEIAQSIELDGAQAHNVMSEESWAHEVEAIEHQWMNAGIQGVPAYIINQKHLITGAQEPATLAQAIREISELD